LIIVIVAAVLVVVSIAGITFGLLHRSGTADAQEATAVAADLPAHRASTLDPELDDNPEAVPVYPADTTITLDQSSWVPVGESASAYSAMIYELTKGYCGEDVPPYL
jgi:hypothetical protein